MRTRRWLFAATLSSIALMLIGLWFVTVFPVFSEVPAWTVEPSSSYYLCDRALNLTKIFVVSATPKYGFYPVDPLNNAIPFMITKGTPVFILEVTIRNDYTPQTPLWRNDSGGNYSCSDVWFCLRAVLTDENGSVLHVPAVTPPYPQMPFGVPQFFQKSGTTQIYNLYFLVNTRNVSHYQIYVSYLSGNKAD